MGVNHTKHLSPSICVFQRACICATAGELSSAAPRKLEALPGLAIASAAVPVLSLAPLQVVKYGSVVCQPLIRWHTGIFGPDLSVRCETMRTGRLTHVLLATSNLDLSLR